MANLTSIQLQLGKYGAVAGNCNLYIYASDEDDNPTGNLLGSSSVACSSLPLYSLEYNTPYTEFPINISIDQNQKYFVYINAPNVPSGAYIRVYITTNVGDFSYLSGRFSFDGSSWSNAAEMCIKMTVDGNLSISGTASGWSNNIWTTRCFGNAYKLGYSLSKPINPIPENNAEDISIHLSKIQWEDGNPEYPADSYDVYFSKVNESLEKLGSTSDTYFPISILQTSRNYKWRVDAAKEGEDTVTGDTWYFSTKLGVGCVRVGYQLEESEIPFYNDLVVDGVGRLYTSGLSHVSETETFDTLRKINEDTGELIWSGFPLGNSQYPGKLFIAGDYIYTAEPSHPFKFNTSDGVQVKEYSNIGGGLGVSANSDYDVFSCGEYSEGKNVWKSNAAGTEQSNAAIGSSTLTDILVVNIDDTDYLFVCGEYDAGQDCDVWKLDIDLQILATYKTGGDSKRIVPKYDEDAIYILHSQGNNRHITKLDYDLEFINGILLSVDRTYEDFDFSPEFGTDDYFSSDIIFDIMTNKRYGAGFNTNMLDPATFGEVLDYCINNQIQLNLALDNKQPLLDWIDYIQSHYFGYLRLG